MTPTTQAQSKPNPTHAHTAWPIAIALLIAMTIFTWAASWTGNDLGPATFDAILVLIQALAWTSLWLAAAAGLGVALRWSISRWIHIDGSLQFALGIAILLVFDAALGTLGLLQIGGTSLAVWLFTGLAIIPLGIRLWKLRRANVQFAPTSPWLLIAIAPAMAVLLLAACSAPGWLWETEFGGYDALSYHLQLPREWIISGSIIPYEHNVYSYLPGYMESAYYHIMAMQGNPLAAVTTCQMLHASLAIVTAFLVARLVRALLGAGPYKGIGVISAAIVLGTPWVVVVGSLAYNEMPTVLMLAAGLTLLIEKPGGALSRGALLGLIIAAAVGSKLTAAGFVALPLIVIMLWQQPKQFAALISTAITSALCLTPWLIRNSLHGGNPVFPFMIDLFGSAHWTSQQVTIWNSAHHADLPVTARFGEAFRQLFTYGYGTNPDPTGQEPWAPQWSILPWLGIAGSVLATTAPRLRRPAMMMLAIIAIQFVFWVALTHIKSRFMLPMVVPASCGIALGLARMQSMFQFDASMFKRTAPVISFIAVAIWCAQPVLLYRAQNDNAPSARIGWVGMRTGDGVPEAQLEQFAAALPEVMVNRLLPDGSRVLLVGEAAPLYYTANVSYSTVWDRGPMSAAIAAHPDDSDQWMNTLRAQGFTHLLLSPTMLHIWRQSGWRDPLLDPETIAQAVDNNAKIIARYPNGVVLYQLHPME